MVETKPYGSWTSPITAESLGNDVGIQFDFNVAVDEHTGIVYWTKSVGAEGGRIQIYSQRLEGSDETTAILPLGYNCRNRVHEYGGGAFAVKKNILYFSNFDDGRLYKINLSHPSEIIPIVPENPYHRYADLTLDEELRFMICACEVHIENGTPKDVVNTLVAIDLRQEDLDQAVTVIAEGNDFYMSPAINPNSTELSFVSYNHPNMPWDSTQLYQAKLSYDNGVHVSGVHCIAGDKTIESIAQPRYALDGSLYAITDRSEFWSVHKYIDDELVPILAEAIEVDQCNATWNFGQADYAPLASDPSKIVCKTKSAIAILDTESGKLIDLPSPFIGFDQVRVANVGGTEYVFFAALSPTAPRRFVAYSLAEKKVTKVLQDSLSEPLSEDYISIPQEIKFPTKHGNAYCFFYPPKNPQFRSEGLPPLRVIIHGGPTSRCDGEFSRDIMYWTTRGIAIANVNHGGSTGFGCTFRKLLEKNWGIVDVDDCCAAALYLAEKGLVDREKLTIQGGSAGGFTTLACMAFRPEVFKAGCSLYGVTDLKLLLEEGHKFESRYMHKLIGKYPEEQQAYYDRSPINVVKNIVCPAILFQGLDDYAVPPSQAEFMIKALNANKVPNAYVTYEGEGHGFRKAENVSRTLELELWFYGQILGFPVEGVEGVEISNFPKN